jgi:hypothetical protein
MVAGMIATQPRKTDIATTLQPMENQAERLGLGAIRRTLVVVENFKLPMASSNFEL